MNTIKHIGRILAVAALSLPLLWGCELFGLDYQQDAKYDDSASSGYVDMTAWEFIQSRPDAFLGLSQAIQRASMQEEYNKPDRTFILLTDNALTLDTYASSYFSTHRVPNPDYPGSGPETIIPVGWEPYPVEQVRNLLEYHILKQPVSIYESMDYKIFFETLAYKYQGDTTFMCTEWVRDRNAKFKFNSFTGHRILDLAPRVSNIRCRNGVIHVFDDYLEPPTTEVLEYYNVVY